MRREILACFPDLSSGDLRNTRRLLLPERVMALADTGGFVQFDAVGQRAAFGEGDGGEVIREGDGPDSRSSPSIQMVRSLCSGWSWRSARRAERQLPAPTGDVLPVFAQLAGAT